jgi:hypothetical protein
MIHLTIAVSLFGLISQPTMKTQGFDSENYQSVRAELALKYKDTVSQFCLNGAAFVLSGQPEYAQQYQSGFGTCIERITTNQRR